MARSRVVNITGTSDTPAATTSTMRRDNSSNTSYGRSNGRDLDNGYGRT